MLSANVTPLLSGLAIGESPRWHAGRLWFSNWGAQQIMAVDLDGNVEQMLRAPTPIPFSIDWLSTGELLVVSGPEAKLLRVSQTGEYTQYADLRHVAGGWNEIVVDSRDNVYVNGSNFKFGGNEPFVPGVIALVSKDGSVRQVADDIHFPNGMVVTPDNRTLIVVESFANRLTAFDIAEDGSLSNRRLWAAVGGDGICMDAEGAIWTPQISAGEASVIRVREGGEVLERIELDKACFACMLGGDDGRTLFMLVAEWRGLERMGELFSSRTGKVLATRAPAPHAGHP